MKCKHTEQVQNRHAHDLKHVTISRNAHLGNIVQRLARIIAHTAILAQQGSLRVGVHAMRAQLQFACAQFMIACTKA
eukprot:1145843-Pelagomonas_calceolata.AAC.7